MIQEGSRPIIWGIKDKQPYPVYSREHYTDEVHRRPHVGDTTIKGVRISTVFLGIDHACGAGPPVLFETMVFEGPLDQYCERYCTWEEAEQGHEKTCDLVRKSQTLWERIKRGWKAFLACFR